MERLGYAMHHSAAVGLHSTMHIVLRHALSTTSDSELVLPPGTEPWR